MATGGTQPIPPDGGWGWVVVASSFLVHVVTDGFIYTSGVLAGEVRDYYGASRREMGWLASTLIAVTFGSSPLTGILINKYGCRTVGILGGLVSALGLVISFFTPKFNFLYFSLGIVTALGLGMSFMPSILVVNHYFEKRRSFAIGLSVCGSGVGTFVMPALVRYLLDYYGWRGTLLIVAGLLLHCCPLSGFYRPLATRADQRKQEANEANKIYKPRHTNQSNGRFTDAESKRLVQEQIDAPGEERNNDTVDSQPPSQRSPTYIISSHKEDPESIVGPVSGQSVPITTACSQASFTNTLLEATTSPTEQDSVSPHTCDVTDPEAEQPADDHKGCSRLTKYLTGSLQCCRPKMWQNKMFVLIMVANFFAAFSYNVPFVFLPDFAEVGGVDKKRSAFLISVIGVLSTVSRVILGWVSDRPFVNRLMLFEAAVVAMGVTIMMFPVSANYAYLIACATVFGVCQAICVALTSVVLVDLFGLQMVATIYGIFLFFSGLGFVVGPPLAGFLYDMSGSYLLSFVSMGALMVAGGLAIVPIPWLSEYKQRQEQLRHEREEKEQLTQQQQLPQQQQLSEEQVPVVTVHEQT